MELAACDRSDLPTLIDPVDAFALSAWRGSSIALGFAMSLWAAWEAFTSEHERAEKEEVEEGPKVKKEEVEKGPKVKKEKKEKKEKPPEEDAADGRDGGDDYDDDEMVRMRERLEELEDELRIE